MPSEETNRDLIVAALGQDAVQSQDDLPAARQDGPRQVARRRVLRAEVELAPRRATPAPEAPGVKVLAATRVKEADVQDVACRPRAVHSVVPREAVVYLQSSYVLRYVKWKVQVGRAALVQGRQVPAEFDGLRWLVVGTIHAV
jgi:hypothetical protein